MCGDEMIVVCAGKSGKLCGDGKDIFRLSRPPSLFISEQSRRPFPNDFKVSIWHLFLIDQSVHKGKGLQ